MNNNSKAPEDNFEQLIELWKMKYSHRAKAGEYALLGFRFQMMVALRDAVRAFLIGQVTEPTVLLEQISDVCQKTSSGKIVFTQVKLTGRTVNSALEELWAIHTLASDELPLLTPQLQYRILCSKWTLQDIESSINRWQPSEDTDPVRIQSFKEQVSYSTDPNPFDELLVLLAHELDADEPFQKVLFWIGLLTDPAHGYRQVWSELVELQRKQRLSTKARLPLWLSEYRPPQTVKRGQVLSSHQPKPIHLQHGYFFERPIYRTLAEETIQWISSNPWESDSNFRVPVLWIGGRSGCGKSVALLHILSQLHEDRLGPIIWLDNWVDLLPEAIRRTPGIAGTSNQVIIALDDPYAPRTQSDAEPWRQALSELHLLQSRTSGGPPPILLCCGPTSQARQLEEDFTDELYIKILTVPHALNDRQALATWYEIRTGAKLPSVGDGDVLLVQLFFEWQTGQPLFSFAHSFKKRLKEEDPSQKMLDTVYRIVAANRFYTGYQPTALNRLNPKQRDAFEFLVEEHHFSIDEDSRRSGIWLTHPHLANGLFEAWFPKATKLHQRQAVIKETILDGLRYGVTPRDQTALLWALARLPRTDKRLRQRLATDKLEDILPVVYSAWRRESQGILNIEHLPAWIEIRFSYPNRTLTPDPVADALAQLLPENSGKTGFRLTCHKLLEYWGKLIDTEQRDVQESIENVLVHTQGWHEWSAIAIDATLRISSQKLRDLFGNWLLGDNQGSPLALSWFNLRQNVGSNRDWLLNFNIKWINQHGDAPDASLVLSSLLKRGDLGSRRISIATVALDWIQKRSLQPQVERVLRRLLGLPLSNEVTARAVRLALDYIEHTELQPTSSFLLSAILRARVVMKAGDTLTLQHSLAKSAIHLGLTWLERYPDDPVVPYVADRLLRLPEISSSDWSKIASQSLARLGNLMWPRDVDYTFVSIVRRRHLLSEQDDDLLYNLLCAWLKRTKQDINQILSQQRFYSVTKLLAPALPLVSHLRDKAFQAEFEVIAWEFRRVADKESREKFDRGLWRLFKAHAWPSKPEGRGALHRLGLIPEIGKFIAILNNFVLTKTKEIESSLEETLDAAQIATEEAIAKGNFKGAGYMLAKMLPLAARLNSEYLNTVVLQAWHFMNLSFPRETRCGFILECDRLIEQSAWPKLELAYQSIHRAGFETPKTLEYLATMEDTAIKESVSRTLDFVEDLFESQPVRVGLFLAPLIVLAEKSGDMALKERYQRVVRSFLESSDVSEGIKNSLDKRVKKLTEMLMPSIPDNLLGAIESLGLQAPWLIEKAKTTASMNVEDLKRHLLVAKQLVERDFPSRAGWLLAPLLFFSVCSHEDDLLKEVYETTLQMLENPRLAHENRDGFIALCRSFEWPDPDTQDEIFQFLGIGAPMLERLLAEPIPAVSVDMLQCSLEHAAKHLRTERPRGAYKILLNALPLASWSDDKNILESALELAQKFMSHPNVDRHILDLFSKGCVQLLQKGRWQNSDIGRACLAKIGIEDV